MNTLTTQPTTNDLLAAYRPIEFIFNVDPNVSPVNFCDIYFNGIYYKTISRSFAESIGNYRFDIRDACQEYLNKHLNLNGGVNIVTKAITTVFCRFRSTTVNANGFIESIYTSPIQGTLSVLPVAGNGLQSNTFYVINATIQQMENWVLKSHLDAYKTGVWHNLVYPLSHQKDVEIGKNDSAYFPIINMSGRTSTCVDLVYRSKSTGLWTTVQNCVPCVPVTIPGNPILPDITVGNNYNYIINLSGSGPFVLSNITKPTWMSIAIVGNTVQFTGSPISADVADNTPVIFRVSNTCGTVLKSTTIDVLAIQSCIAITLDVVPIYPDGIVGQPYNYSFPLEGSAPFVLINTVKPTWMVISIAGNTVQLSGTPDAVQANIAVNIEIGNCTNNSAIVQDIINVVSASSIVNFSVVNESSVSWSIDSVSPLFYSTINGSFPVLQTGNFDGHHNGFEGEITVIVSTIGPLPAASLYLYRNGILLQQIPIQNASSFNFNYMSYFPNDSISIILS